MILCRPKDLRTRLVSRKRQWLNHGWHTPHSLQSRPHFHSLPFRSLQMVEEHCTQVSLLSKVANGLITFTPKIRFHERYLIRKRSKKKKEVSTQHSTVSNQVHHQEVQNTKLLCLFPIFMFLQTPKTWAGCHNKTCHVCKTLTHNGLIKNEKNTR